MHFRSDPVRRKNRKALLNKRRSTSQSPKGKKSMRKNGSSGTDSETERRFKGRRRRMSSIVRPKVPRPTEGPAQETRKRRENWEMCGMLDGGMFYLRGSGFVCFPCFIAVELCCGYFV